MIRISAFRPLHVVGFIPITLGISLRTTTIHVSGLNTDPASLIHLASDSRHRVYPQVSLPPCRLRFRRMGLELLRSHPLGNSNQFQYLHTSQSFGFISARAAPCYIYILLTAIYNIIHNFKFFRLRHIPPNYKNISI